MATVTLLGSAFDTNSGTHTVTATPAVGDLIVIVVANTGSTASVAPTDNNTASGGTYEKINASVKASSADTMEAYIRSAPISAAVSTVFTHAPGTTTGGGLLVFKITGMHRSGVSAALQSAIQSNQAAATPAPVFGATPQSGNPIIAAVFNATNPATMTPRSSPAYTEAADLGYATPTTGLEAMYINSGETSATITWGNASASAFCSIAVEIDTSTNPAFSTLTDTFSGGSLNTAIWNSWGGANIVESGGQLTLSTTASSTNYYGFDTNYLKNYNLTGSYVMVQAVSIGNQALNSYEAYPVNLQIDNDTRFFIFVNLNNIAAVKRLNASNSTVGSATYSSSVHKWFGITEASGTVHFWYATTPTGPPSVANGWTELGTGVTTTGIDVTNLYGGAEVGTWQAEASSTSMVIDNWNVAPSSGIPNRTVIIGQSVNRAATF